MLKNRILSSVGGEEKLYSNDVFSTYLYTGNGSTQTINNGIDLAGKGGMVWTKTRNAGAYQQHVLYDTARGATKYLATNLTGAENTTANTLNSFSNNGFTLGNSIASNASVDSYVSWTFRKAPKFFDIVTYTGNGVAGRQIPHGLGIAPGMVVVKATSTTGDWIVWHRGIADGYSNLILNATSAAGAVYYGSVSEPSSTVFKVGGVNTNGITYVAYLFAHDPSADGIIQCGSFTTDASGNATVNLGWEPQYLMVKTSGVAGSWDIFDSMRGLNVSATVRLSANTSSQENNQTTNYVKPTATGFEIVNGWGGASNTYVYLAIRRPNQPPTTGTKVYNAIARTGTGAAATVTGVGFAPDLAMIVRRAVGGSHSVIDRLRGRDLALYSAVTDAEAAQSVGVDSFNMDGVTLGTASPVNASAATLINHFFKRSLGFMDVVCYPGTGVARTVSHSLGVAPELMIVKSRVGVGSWVVYAAGMGPTKAILLNFGNASVTAANFWNDTAPSATAFTTGDNSFVNNSGASFVAYLFASLTGISKVGSYTGNGTTQTINCGFTTGARFILIKATSTTGNWIVADSTRGILSGADPALYLNSTAAEVTGVDWVDPNIVGFDIIQEGTMNANVNGTNYIYLAIS